MFGRYFHAKLRAARRALDGGRVDEALRLATAEGVSDADAAKALLDDVGLALVARARLHAQAGRYADALLDLDRLDAIGRGGPERVGLRQRIEREMHAVDGKRAAADKAYRAAAERVKAGRLESGRLAAQRVDDDRRRAQLEDDLDFRAARGGQLLQQAAGALDAGDPLSAWQAWREAVTRHGRTNESDAVAQRLWPALRGFGAGAFERGDLADLRRTMAIVGDEPEPLRQFDVLRKLDDLTQRAADLLAERRYRELRETLLRLQAVGAAGWVRSAVEATDALLAGYDRLIASPLGLLSVDTASPAQTRPEGGRSEATLELRTQDLAAAPAPPPLPPGPRLLLVDGTGSALLLSRDVVRLGRAGGSRHIDVPLPADLLSHHADIYRQNDDYILVAHGPAQVNRASVTRAVLRDGDRVRLGAQAKFTFRRPTAKSESATLQIADRFRLAGDAAQVILWSDTVMLGPSSSCHVRLREGTARIVLFRRDGRILAQLGDLRLPPTLMPLDETVNLGDVSMTMTKFEA